jgi:hypothetical protein
MMFFSGLVTGALVTALVLTAAWKPANNVSQSLAQCRANFAQSARNFDAMHEYFKTCEARLKQQAASSPSLEPPQ